MAQSDRASRRGDRAPRRGDLRARRGDSRARRDAGRTSRDPDWPRAVRALPGADAVARTDGQRGDCARHLLLTDLLPRPASRAMVLLAHEPRVRDSNAPWQPPGLPSGVRAGQSDLASRRADGCLDRSGLRDGGVFPPPAGGGRADAAPATRPPRALLVLDAVGFPLLHDGLGVLSGPVDVVPGPRLLPAGRVHGRGGGSMVADDGATRRAVQPVGAQRTPRLPGAAVHRPRGVHPGRGTPDPGRVRRARNGRDIRTRGIGRANLLPRSRNGVLPRRPPQAHAGRVSS